MNTQTYLAPQYPTLEALLEYEDIYDASTLSYLGDCPRKFFYRTERKLVKRGISRKMLAGSALHAALDYHYAGADREECVAAIEEVFVIPGMTPPGKGEDHLHLGHLIAVFDNYLLHYAEDNYQPLFIQMEDINLENVLYAEWWVTDEGVPVLGESRLVMRFGGLALAGRPDLPVYNRTNDILVMDHKTTSSYLSGWWANTHRVSNKLRGYVAMIHSLTGKPIRGGMINALYVGPRATLPEFKGTCFARFPFDWTELHLKEALQNQASWIDLVTWHRERGTWPQNAGMMCRSCDYVPLCQSPPDLRHQVAATDYIENEYNFFGKEPEDDVTHVS